MLVLLIPRLIGRALFFVGAGLVILGVQLIGAVVAFVQGLATLLLLYGPALLIASAALIVTVDFNTYSAQVSPVFADTATTLNTAFGQLRSFVAIIDRLGEVYNRIAFIALSIVNAVSREIPGLPEVFEYADLLRAFRGRVVRAKTLRSEEAAMRAMADQIVAEFRPEILARTRGMDAAQRRAHAAELTKLLTAYSAYSAYSAFSEAEGRLFVDPALIAALDAAATAISKVAVALIEIFSVPLFLLLDIFFGAISVGPGGEITINVSFVVAFAEIIFTEIVRRIPFAGCLIDPDAPDLSAATILDELPKRLISCVCAHRYTQDVFTPVFTIPGMTPVAFPSSVTVGAVGCVCPASNPDFSKSTVAFFFECFGIDVILTVIDNLKNIVNTAKNTANSALSAATNALGQLDDLSREINDLYRRVTKIIGRAERQARSIKRGADTASDETDNDDKTGDNNDGESGDNNDGESGDNNDGESGGSGESGEDNDDNDDNDDNAVEAGVLAAAIAEMIDPALINSIFVQNNVVARELGILANKTEAVVAGLEHDLAELGAQLDDIDYKRFVDACRPPQNCTRAHFDATHGARPTDTAAARARVLGEASVHQAQTIFARAINSSIPPARYAERLADIAAEAGHSPEFKRMRDEVGERLGPEGARTLVALRRTLNGFGRWLRWALAADITRETADGAGARLARDAHVRTMFVQTARFVDARDAAAPARAPRMFEVVRRAVLDPARIGEITAALQQGVTNTTDVEAQTRLLQRASSLARAVDGVTGGCSAMHLDLHAIWHLRNMTALLNATTAHLDTEIAGLEARHNASMEAYLRVVDHDAVSFQRAAQGIEGDFDLAGGTAPGHIEPRASTYDFKLVLVGGAFILSFGLVGAGAAGASAVAPLLLGLASSVVFVAQLAALAGANLLVKALDSSAEVFTFLDRVFDAVRAVGIDALQQGLSALSIDVLLQAVRVQVEENVNYGAAYAFYIATCNFPFGLGSLKCGPKPQPDVPVAVYVNDGFLRCNYNAPCTTTADNLMQARCFCPATPGDPQSALREGTRDAPCSDGGVVTGRTHCWPFLLQGNFFPDVDLEYSVQANCSAYRDDNLLFWRGDVTVSGMLLFARDIALNSYTLLTYAWRRVLGMRKLGLEGVLAGAGSSLLLIPSAITQAIALVAAFQWFVRDTVLANLGGATDTAVGLKSLTLIGNALSGAVDTFVADFMTPVADAGFTERDLCAVLHTPVLVWALFLFVAAGSLVGVTIVPTLLLLGVLALVSLVSTVFLIIATLVSVVVNAVRASRSRVFVPRRRLQPRNTGPLRSVVGTTGTGSVETQNDAAARVRRHLPTGNCVHTSLFGHRVYRTLEPGEKAEPMPWPHAIANGLAHVVHGLPHLLSPTGIAHLVHDNWVSWPMHAIPSVSRLVRAAVGDDAHTPSSTVPVILRSDVPAHKRGPNYLYYYGDADAAAIIDDPRIVVVKEKHLGGAHHGRPFISLEQPTRKKLD